MPGGGASEGEGLHSARRRAISSSSTRRTSDPVVTSIVIASPSRTSAMGPPRAASGHTWPTKQPLLVPEKRPSVTIAADAASPRPTRYFMGAYISGMPGPPRGPT